MRAIVKLGNQVRATEHPTPGARAQDDVVVEVICAGLCRSDQYVAHGWLPSASPVVLGHELAGRVVEIGEGVSDLGVGDHVTLDPWFDSTRIGARPSRPHEQLATFIPPGRRDAMFGAQADGAFAEFIVTPRRQLHRVPFELSWRRAAFVEPIAAALCVLHDPIVRACGRRPRAVIGGSGRIAQLTRQILAHHGIDVPCVALHGLGHRRSGDTSPVLEPDSLQWAVETEPQAGALAALIDALEPGGTLLLKSRPPSPVALDLREIVLRRLVLRGIDYASFDDAIHLAGDLKLDLERLFAAPVGPQDFTAALLDLADASVERVAPTIAVHPPRLAAHPQSQESESKKQFLTWQPETSWEG